MPIKVEYLITYDIKGHTLETISNFQHLLMSNSLINIDNKKLVFDNTEFLFEVITHEITDKKQRIFKINISCIDISLMEKMSDLLKIIREFANRTEGKITILWDEISNHYSSLSYPEISKIENLLRKLITYFMVTNFGFEWTKNSIPLDLKNGVKKNRDVNNFLHDTDFIQLSDFLFKPYASKNVEVLFKDIKDRKLESTIDYSYFEQFLPKSNWERYFNKFVKYEDGSLTKKWSKLYELRCLIAHNNFINKNHFDEINELVSDLTEKFDNAIISIEEIIVPLDEREAVLQSVIKAHNEKFSIFIAEWQEIVNEIFNLAKLKKIKYKEDDPISEIVQELIKNGVVTENFFIELKPLGEFRNRINNLNEIFDDSEIEKHTKLASDFHFMKFIMGDDVNI